MTKRIMWKENLHVKLKNSTKNGASATCNSNERQHIKVLFAL